MANKKYVSLSKLQTFLDNLKDTFATLTHTHKVSDLTDYTVDSALSGSSTNPVQNKVLDAEFDAISQAMGVLEEAIDGKADSSHNHKVSDISDLTVTATELNHLDGVTDNVQVQLDSKSDSTHTHSNASLGQGCGYCSTSSSTVEKTVSLSNYIAKTGGIVSVEFVYSVPASATMNINNTGASQIYYRGSAITKDIIKGGDTATFIFDGIRYHLISVDRWHEDIVELQATDEKVKQMSTSANGNFRLLLTPSYQTETTTAQTYFNSGLYANPSTNKIYADISGNAGSASKLNVDAGSVSQPVYFAGGVPVVATDIISKADQHWNLLYDSGEISAIANSISNIDVSGYTNIQVLVRLYNDGDSIGSRAGSAIFTCANGKTYQFPVWSSMFSKSINTVYTMATFNLVDGWLICPYASRLIGDASTFEDEGGTAGNLALTGSGMMKCTSQLSTLTISNLDQNSNYYFGMGSRVMVWGWNA